eukprot:2899473-Pleurochrysis_carterae.AAC.4
MDGSWMVLYLLLTHSSFFTPFQRASDDCLSRFFLSCLAGWYSLPSILTQAAHLVAYLLTCELRSFVLFLLPPSLLPAKQALMASELAS